MTIHSRFLVHWTGAEDIEKHSDVQRPQLYVERLKDDLIKGLFTKRTSEDSIRQWKIKGLLRICFTEIRLSQAQTHAARYGRLGIGFAREFIMNKGGRPVIYVPFHSEPDGRLLEDSIRNLYEHSKDSEEIHKFAKWVMAHVKRMSNGKTEDSGDYKDYYEEMEWRLVYDERSTNRHFTKEGDDVYRVTFAASDLKVIIFPDEPTKELALKDEAITRYFSVHMPILTTLTDCSSF